MKNYTNQIRIRSVFTALCICFSLAACKKAENYYQKLHDQPEIYTNYNLAYGVGDTLSIGGRLNPENNLVITIGGVKAELFNVQFNEHTGDVAFMIITEEMGIGANRLVKISSGGNTIDAPAIEIVEGQNSGVLPGRLKAVQHSTLSFTATPLYCNSGTGSIYLWNTDRTISHIHKDGTRVTVLAQENLRDAHGAFQVTTFQSGAVDARERYLYFSALTTDGSSDNATNAIYRLCRYDLQNKQLTTLNRTLYPNAPELRTAASAQPFEGQISNVKVYQLTRLFPDSEGNVYAVISNRAIARLTADGNFQYLFKGLRVTGGNFVPQTWNPNTGSYYEESEQQAVANLLPGIRLPDGTGFVNIDPNENLLYAGNYGTTLKMQFDLINRVEIHRFGQNDLNFQLGPGKPYISGSFSLVTGNESNTNLPGLFGAYPLPGKRVLILYYQNVALINSGIAQSLRPQYPAWGVLDYTTKRGYRYAPYKFEVGSYRMTETDRILNTDEEGMVYMTANQNTVIIKTQYQ